MKFTALFAAAVLTLAGCATTAGSASEETPRGTNAPAAASEAAAVETDAPAAEETTEPSDEPTESGTATFGQTYTYGDGLGVTVGKPKPFKPSEYSIGLEDGAKYLKFQIRIVNNTGKKYDPTMFSVSAQSGNSEAEQVFDSEQGIDGTPSTKVLDGREVEFPVVFAVSDVKDVVMDVSSGWDYEEATFTS